MLPSAFKHWRQLAYAEYPRVNKRKLTSGLKQLAEMVVRHRNNYKGMIEQFSWVGFKHADAQLEIEEESLAKVLGREDDKDAVDGYAELQKMDHEEVCQYLDLAYSGGQLAEGVYELRPRERQQAVDNLAS